MAKAYAKLTSLSTYTKCIILTLQGLKFLKCNGKWNPWTHHSHMIYFTADHFTLFRPISFLITSDNCALLLFHGIESVLTYSDTPFISRPLYYF